MTNFGGLQIIRCFRTLCGVHKSMQPIHALILVSFDIYIYIYYALLRVKFENEFSVSVSRNQATCYKNLKLDTGKFLKLSTILKFRSSCFSFQTLRVCSNSFTTICI